MRVTPRYLVQLSSAEIAFLHALVQRHLRGFVGERPEGRGIDPVCAPPELVSLDRRLLVRLEEVTRDEDAYFGGRKARPETGWIDEEHAALAEAAARYETNPRPVGAPGGAGAAGRRSRGTATGGARNTAPEAPAVDAADRSNNVVPLRGPGRPTARAG